MSSHKATFEQKFEDALLSQRLLEPGTTLILGVSGGIDSMVLLRMFSILQSSWKLNLAVAHINHQLRGQESIDDEQFVKGAADELKIPFFAKRVETLEHAHKYRLSKQEAARELRYQFFDHVRGHLSAAAVATAHHAGDNAETVLLNALRGAGIRGLSGIPLRRGYIIRPLLFAYREEIQEYAVHAGVSYRCDTSNESLEYRRNFLRHSVLPMLRAEFDPQILNSLNRLSRAARQLDEGIHRQVEEAWPQVMSKGGHGKIALSISGLHSKPPYLQEAIILEILRMLDLEPTADKVEAVLHLCHQQTGRHLHLSHSIKVFRNRDRVDFVHSLNSGEYSQTVSIGATYNIVGSQVSLSMHDRGSVRFTPSRFAELVDAATLGSKLVLRTWKRGDWFVPLGMKARKKVSDYFTDEKIPLYEKSTIPLLESDGKIVWVCGHRLDDRFKVTDKTLRVVKLSYAPNFNN